MDISDNLSMGLLSAPPQLDDLLYLLSILAFDPAYHFLSVWTNNLD